MINRKILVAVLFAFVISSCTAIAAKPPYRLGIGIDPGPSTAQQRQAWNHLAQALGRQLHVPVALEVLDSGVDELQALERGTADLALIKAVPYADAKARGTPIAALATVVSHNENEEVTTHSAYIVVRPNSGIAHLADLRGKRFGFVRGSSSGLAFPAAYLLENGLDYRTTLSGFRCFESHDAMIAALNAGQIDGGSTYRSPALARNADLAHLRVIARVADIPNPVIAASSRLSGEQKQSIAKALIELPESAFQGVGFYGFKPVDEKLYEAVGEIDQARICD